MEGEFREVVERAIEIIESCTTWAEAHGKVFGVDGYLGRLFDDRTTQCRFRDSFEYRVILESLAELRARDTNKSTATQPMRILTIRLPQSVHQAMAAEADSMRVSINQLGISKLLVEIDPRLVPDQQTQRRGRRPRIGT